MKHNHFLALLGTTLFHGAILTLLIFTIDKTMIMDFSGTTSNERGLNSISLQMLQNITMEQEQGSSKPTVAKVVKPTVKQEVADPTVQASSSTKKISNPRKDNIKDKSKPSADNTNEARSANMVSSASSSSKIQGVQDVAGDNSNSSVIGSYLGALRREIEAQKFYPQRAKLMRKQGTAVVEMTIMPNGELQNIHIKSSSGSSDLDQAAIRAVERAKSVGERPQGVDAVISVPITFSIH